MRNNEKNPKVSIIVPAKNEEKHIEKCVKSLLGILYDDMEIIIVNDGSIDKTGEILDKYSDKLIIINTKGLGPSKCRNLAVKEAKGQLIAFTDADCTVDKYWISELLKGFEKNDSIGVGGSQLNPSDQKEFSKIVSKFFETFGFVSNYVHFGNDIRDVKHNPTCNVLYKREVFDLAGYFREDLWPCEDLEFDLRIKRYGLSLANNPKALVYHYRPESFNGFLKMMLRYGQGHSKLNLIHGFTELIHYLPLFVFVFISSNLMLYENDFNCLMIVNVFLLVSIFLFVLIMTKNVKTGAKVFGLFLSSILYWIAGFMKETWIDYWRN